MTEVLVVDCSVTMGWLEGIENDDTFQYTDAVLEMLKFEGKAIVPSLWPYEVSNVLTTLIRNKHISQSEANNFVRMLGELDIQVFNESHLAYVPPRISLACENNLSAYDAGYLNLAIQSQCPLATCDKKLIKAAKRNQVYCDFQMA